MDLQEFAKLNADRIRRRSAKREIDQLSAAREPADSAEVAAFDADSESYVVRANGQNVTVNQPLSNAGVTVGDLVELIPSARAFDSTPRTRQPITDDPVLGIDEPWGVLIEKRAFIGTESIDRPPREAEFSDPVPASWCLVYRWVELAGVIEYIPWDPSAQVRYANFPDERFTQRFNEDDPYCRYTVMPWTFIPQQNLYQSLRGRFFCKVTYTGPPAGIDGSGYRRATSEMLIGSIAFSPDGVDAVPTDADRIYNFPRVALRSSALNPSPPPTFIYAACPLEPDPETEFEYEWELVEVIPFTDYVPPQLLSPAHPGGIETIEKFSTEYWLFSNEGTFKIVTIPDTYHPENPEGERPDITPFFAVDANGKFYLDLKVRRFDLETGFITEQELLHYEIVGGAANEVDEGQSWRRRLTNTLLTVPLPGEDFHPCVAQYLNQKNVVLFETERRLLRTFSVTPATLQAGVSGTLQAWNLTDTPTCQIAPTPDRTQVLSLTPFSPELINFLPQERWSIVDFVAHF
jgi:hypothetical protein